MAGNTNKKKVRGFLFKIVNKEFLIFLFFLVVSGIFWLVLTMKEPLERELIIPVKITNVPQNVVMIDGDTDTLRVTIRDNGYNTLAYSFQNITPVTVNFSNYLKGDGHSVVPASEVMKLAKSQLERSTQVISVKPEKLDIYYTYGGLKRVPVEIDGRWSPDSKSFIVGIKASPDSVTVYATSEQLEQLSSVKTQFFNITGVTDVVRRQVPLLTAKGVRCKPDVVEVEVRADILTEGKVEVPIVAVNVPEGKVVRTFPSAVEVTFATGANLLDQMDASLFRVEVDYNEIDDNLATRYLTLHLKNSPQVVKNTRLTVTSVDYLLEDQ